MSFSVTHSPAPIQLWFAGPDLQVEYDPQALSPADRDRETGRLASRNAHEWRVSRALQRRLLTPYRASNLSHSDGHALWAASSLHEQIGVDLEKMKAVDELALAELVCDEQELALLRRLHGPDRMRLFYRLWTLKEALVKAAGGDFPADMFKVGVRRCVSASASRDWQLTGLGNGRWSGVSAMIGEDWMMALVWPGQDSVGAQNGMSPDLLAHAIFARQALPADARPLILEQTVWFHPPDLAHRSDGCSGLESMVS